MPKRVSTSPLSIDSYRSDAGDEAIDEIKSLANHLSGARILHVNSTSYGGGVAEILHTIIPLLRDLGIHADWQVIAGNEAFFQVTKSMHHAMQGMDIPWNQEMIETWMECNRDNARTIGDNYDFIYIHDPQPAGLKYFVREQMGNQGTAKWLWRCHLDTTEANVQVWDFLKQYVQDYDAAIFTLPEYVREPLAGPVCSSIPPAIDPISPKNRPMSDEQIAQILLRFDIDTERPILSQISRFDPWKDPLGVVDVYRILKKEYRNLQLVMIASMAHDDPEGWTIYEQLIQKAGADADIHVLTNFDGIDSVEVNAIQRASTVVIQKSIREGFGLVISEALWKNKAMVGSQAGGIPLQMDFGRVGRIASTTQQFAEAVSDLLDKPQVRASLGLAAREHVREHFLSTRLLSDHLRLLRALDGN